MSKIAAFLEQAGKNREIREKLTALQKETGETLIAGLVALSAEAGTPISAEEWSTAREAGASKNLSSEELDALSGGGFFPPVITQLK